MNNDVQRGVPKWFAVAATIASALHFQPCAADSSDLKSVALWITNDSEFTLRCTAIVAHFVTDNLGRLRPGKTLLVPLKRHQPAGGLAHGSYRKEPMWLENIRCGVDESWTATATDIPLQHLRVPTVSQLRVSCSLRERVACDPLDD